MDLHTHLSLKELQDMDLEIASVQSIVRAYEAKLEEVEQPVQHLEKEVQALGKRLKEVKVEENRLELSIEERRVRTLRLEERMNSVRNLREEAAVHAEMQMVRRALENDEQEALSLLDQIRRMEERMGEHEAGYQEALAAVEPRRRELLDEKEAAEARLREVRNKREAFASSIDPLERRTYERIMAGARDVAVAELTDDGACGNCFSMIPLQLQSEVRRAAEMIRCEECGVILTPASAEGIARAAEEAARIGEALRASEEAREAERAARAAQKAAEIAADEEVRLLAELEAAEAERIARANEPAEVETDASESDGAQDDVDAAVEDQPDSPEGGTRDLGGAEE